ncbi:S8 family peptidase [Haladaptatus sp. NG-WS-4]
MKIDRRSLIKGIGAAGTTLLVTGFALASDGQARYLVRGSKDIATAVAGAGFEVTNELADGAVLLVTGPDGAVEDLQNIRGVADAMHDIEFELQDPVANADGEAAGLPETPEDAYNELLWDKQMQQVEEAHEYATGAGRTIAIIDTGIDHEHPDLNVDVENSVAVVEGELVDHTGAEHYHATHVAGTAAGTGDELMTGTAPGATLISVRVLYGGSGSFGDIMVGMEYAGNVGVDAANISLGFMAPPQNLGGLVGQLKQMYEPVANRATHNGTLLVGSAGNDDTDLQGGWLRLWNGLAGVLGVSALSPDGERTFYSNYGTNMVDVGAPGGTYEDIIRTYAGYAEWIKAGEPLTPADDPRVPGTETHVCFDDDGNLVAATSEDAEEAAVCYPATIPEWPYPFNLVFSSMPAGEYSWLAGTSMAAPQVTGLAALVRELNPDASARQVENAIKQAAEGENGQSDPVLGAGRVNALKTVEQLR